MLLEMLPPLEPLPQLLRAVSLQLIHQRVTYHHSQHFQVPTALHLFPLPMMTRLPYHACQFCVHMTGHPEVGLQVMLCIFIQYDHVMQEDYLPKLDVLAILRGPASSGHRHDPLSVLECILSVFDVYCGA